VVERHPRVLAYTKNHNLGFDVPYRYGSESRKYRPDFIVLVDDGHGKPGENDPLHLVVETKGYRREDAKDKKLTMEAYWIPGVNYLGTYGRWAFVEFTDVFEIEKEFGRLVDHLADVNKMVGVAGGLQPAGPNGAPGVPPSREASADRRSLGVGGQTRGI
jgi:type III restriction enzyme